MFLIDNHFSEDPRLCFGRRIRAGRTFREAGSFVYLGHVDTAEGQRPVVMDRDALKHGIDLDPDIFVLEPDVKILWVSEEMPNQTYLRDLIEYFDTLGFPLTHKTWPSGTQLVKPFIVSECHWFWDFVPGDEILINKTRGGRPMVYCGQYKGTSILAIEGDDLLPAPKLCSLQLSGKTWNVYLWDGDGACLVRPTRNKDLAAKIRDYVTTKPQPGSEVRVDGRDALFLVQTGPTSCLVAFGADVSFRNSNIMREVRVDDEMYYVSKQDMFSVKLHAVTSKANLKLALMIADAPTNRTGSELMASYSTKYWRTF